MSSKTLGREIVYIPLGSTWRTLVYESELLKAASMYSMKGRVLKISVPLSEEAYSPERRQFNALVLLDQVSRLKGDFDLCMGVTASDIFVPQMNFVFGVADVGRGCAVLSIFRLAFGRYEEAQEVFRERVLKEAAHELGHLLGLNHCKNRSCLMSFSNSLAEVDMKKPILCERCVNLLRMLSE